jgi:tRNA 2-thiouridine synthesizing protein E
MTCVTPKSLTTGKSKSSYEAVIFQSSNNTMRGDMMNLPERDGDGYLVDSSEWTPEIARAMAQVDGVNLDDIKWQQILKAREYYDEHAIVPPIRKFSKYLAENQKDMFKMWMTGPMKPITKYGGLPKPTGCV